MVFGIHRLNKFFEVTGRISVILNGIIYLLVVLVFFIGMGIGMATESTALPWYSYPILFTLFIAPFLIYLTASISFFTVLKQTKTNGAAQK